MTNVWKTLSAIDVSAQIEKKGNLSYLSWAWAWGKLMECYPESNYEFLPHEANEDGSLTVNCAVTVEGITRTMWLPVMDNRNNAIKNPDARKISDTKMRCLVKCIAMFGLGHYIYAGEDLPPAEAEPHPALELMENDKMAFYVCVIHMGEEEQTDAFNSFPAGQKTKGKDLWRKALMEGKAEFEGMLDDLRKAISNDDDLGVKENVEGLLPQTKKLLWSMLTGEQKDKAKELLK